MIHLTVSAPVRTVQRARDLVKQHAHAHTHGGTHTRNPRASQGRAGQDARPCGRALRPAAPALPVSVSRAAGPDGHRAPARAHVREPVASQSLFSR